MDYNSFSEQLGFFLEFWGLTLWVFKQIWWVFIPLFLFLVYYIWLINKRFKYLDSVNYLFLAIIVPLENDKGPGSMEQLFAGLYAVESKPNFVEKYFEGKVQDILSMEIVGINGNIRFLIRTPDYYRDLVEANVYAQYPEAEITEVEDYTKFAPNYFPSEKYDLFGTDIILTKKDAYPIRTYEAFATDIGEEEFIDPIAMLTESLSRLSEGEQIWVQLVIRPTYGNWEKEGERIIAKIAGKKIEEKESAVEKPFKLGVGLMHGIFKGLESTLGFVGVEHVEKKDLPSLVQYLTAGEQEVVEAIDKNISKVGFEVKFRFIYIARKEVFSKPKGVSSFFGSINLFNTRNLNGFKPNKKTKTKVDYFKFRIPRRQRKIMRNYKLRRMDQGATPFVFNIEELATVFHFPYTTVKAPTITHTEAKTKEPPADLPIE